MLASPSSLVPIGHSGGWPWVPTTRLLATPGSSWSQNLCPSRSLQMWRRSITGSNGPHPMTLSLAWSKSSSWRQLGPSLAPRRLPRASSLCSRKSMLPSALLRLCSLQRVAWHADSIVIASCSRSFWGPDSFLPPQKGRLWGSSQHPRDVAFCKAPLLHGCHCIDDCVN